MTAPDPAALLAAMEAAAQDYREQCLPEITLLTDDLAALCAAFRASQEREAAAVAALEPITHLPEGGPVGMVEAVLWIGAAMNARRLLPKDAAP